MSSKKANARIEKWRLMISEGITKDPILLKSRIRKGIPGGIRAFAWPQIIQLKKFIQKHEKEYTFDKLVNSPSASIYEISLDIPRTFPEQEDTKILRRSLNNVLKSISIIYPKVGYCQGMNFLALRLLQILEDEETFWILNYLFENDRSLMKNFIDPKRIEEQMHVFQQICKVYLPKISARLQNQNISAQIFTVKWFMTIFSSVLNQQHFYRVFQIFLNEGWLIIYSVGLAFLGINQSKILQNTFQENLFLITSEMYHIQNVDKFMQEVFKYDVAPNLISKYQNQYRQYIIEKNARRQGDISGNSSMIKLRQAQNKKPTLPVPQLQTDDQLFFQSKAEQITFEVFQLLEQAKIISK